MFLTTELCTERHEQRKVGRGVIVNLAHIRHVRQHARRVLEEGVLLERRHAAAQSCEVGVGRLRCNERTSLGHIEQQQVSMRALLRDERGRFIAGAVRGEQEARGDAAPVGSMRHPRRPRSIAPSAAWRQRRRRQAEQDEQPVVERARR